ncbi:MAG: NAD(P)H-dependent oxidoreductase subunit E [Candidatus Fermentibacteria bacterium]|nr:NAD(P)H-dependent oxidoreductase subunit E [Candidatus Fermentibacteria bacterium]
MTRNPLEIVAGCTSEFGDGPESILQILIKVNEELSYVSAEAVDAVAEATGVSPGQVYSVVSFYSFLSSSPRGRNIVRICSTISCAMAGQGDVLSALVEEFGIAPFETTEDSFLTIETTSCIGLCDQAPAMLVNGTPYGNLTPGKACEIVRGLKRAKD